VQSFLIKPKSKKSFFDKISVLKYSTRENYQAAIRRFEQFCDVKYHRIADEIALELKSIATTERDDAYYGLLQDFVNWLVGFGLAHATINMYFQIVTYYFSHHGIRAHSIDIRQNVKRPKKIREKLHPLTKEEIIKIFEYAPQKRKMLYLVLIGSGMRIQESVALRRKDFDLEWCKRIKIEIPAQFTKAQTAHTTFVSNEAAQYLRSHLESLRNNDLVFATNENPFHAKMTEIEAFTRYRNKAGLTEKYQSTNRHHISLHSFRSYFFTRARQTHDTDVAHAMIGHTTYLDMYDRKNDEEKLWSYLKVEPKLRIMT